MKEHNEDQKNRNKEETPIYLTSDSTLQTNDEDRRDKANDPHKNDRIEVSNDD